MSQNLSSAAIVISALRANYPQVVHKLVKFEYCTVQCLSYDGFELFSRP